MAKIISLVVFVCCASLFADEINEIYSKPTSGVGVRKSVNRQSKTRRRRARKPGTPSRSVAAYQARRRFLRLGLDLSADGIMGLVSGGNTSTGLGFGAGLSLMGLLSSRVHFTVGLGFRSLSLSNALDGSGIITDPDAPGLLETHRYATGRLMVGILISKLRLRRNKINWWIDAGAEFLYTLSSSQSSGLVIGNLDFVGDNLLLARLGPSSSLNIARGWFLGSSLHLFYNVAGQGGSKLLGAQLTLALQRAL